MKEMDKKNKLIQSLTFKTVLVLSAFTTIITAVSGCKKMNKTDISSLNSDITTLNTVETENNPVDTTSEIGVASTIEDSSKLENDISSSIDSSINSSIKSSTNNSQIPSNSEFDTSSFNNNTTNNSSDVTNNDENFQIDTTLTANNINDVDTFKIFAEKFSSHCTSGGIFTVFKITYDGQTYYTDGEKEIALVLALLNIDYMDKHTLAELFGDYSLDEFRICAKNAKTVFVESIRQYYCNYYFETFCINKNYGKYLDEYIEEYQKENKNYALLEQKTKDYFINKNTNPKYGENYWIDYFISQLILLDSNSNFEISFSIELGKIAYQAESNYLSKIEELYILLQN